MIRAAWSSDRPRLKLFDSVITPTVLYSLSTTPLTEAQLRKLDATQRKMLRRIVGWSRDDDESSEETGRRMKRLLEAGLKSYPIKDWSISRAARRESVMRKASDSDVSS